MTDVTVLMPARDEEEHIEVALRSVLATAEGARVVVVDDGSRDATPAIVRKCFPEVDLMGSGGVGIARSLNLGLRAASTPFVARADADDECLPGRFREPYTRLVADPGAVLCATGYRENDREIIPPMVPRALGRALLRGNVLAHGSVMYRRDAVLGVGGYDPRAEPAEDYDLWLRLLGEGRFLCVPEILYVHRSASGKSFRRKRRRGGRAVAAAQWRHYRRTGRIHLPSLLRNLVGAVWPGPRPSEIRDRLFEGP